MKLYHFSDIGDIRYFEPRTPTHRPGTEPLVYAISEEHSPLYYFPRSCPRIATWIAKTTSASDAKDFFANGEERIKCFLDRSSEGLWRAGKVFRYGFDSSGFEDQNDYGDWVSRAPQIPLKVELIDNLPLAAMNAGMSVNIVPSLVNLGRELFDFDNEKWSTTLHVSMVRMRLLAGWQEDLAGVLAPRQSLGRQ